MADIERINMSQITQVVNTYSHEPTDDDAYIGRKDSDEHFGNPFSHKKSDIAQVKVKTREESIDLFRKWILGEKNCDIDPDRRLWILDNLERLRGKNLVCFCSPKPCHGDVYLKLLGMKPEDIEALKTVRTEEEETDFWGILMEEEDKKVIKEENEKVMAATGHRPGKLNNEYDGTGPMSQAIKEELRKILREHQPSKVITGMALGVDMLWAEVALEEGIPVAAYIPCSGQDSVWPETSRKRYRDILDQCIENKTFADKYSPPAMRKRNQEMVDDSTILVAVWDGSSGGTSNCVKYAEKVGREMIHINPRQYQNLKGTYE